RVRKRQRRYHRQPARAGQRRRRVRGPRDGRGQLMSFLRRQSLPLVALFVALGGTAYAATTFPAHSIGARQLKRNAVTRTKLAANAVTGAKVAPNSLRGADVRESALAEIGSAARSDDAEKPGGATATAYERSANGSCGAYERIGSIS